MVVNTSNHCSLIIVNFHIQTVYLSSPCSGTASIYIYIYSNLYSLLSLQEQLEGILSGLDELCTVVLYAAHLVDHPSSSHSASRTMDCGCTCLLCIWAASFRVPDCFIVSESQTKTYFDVDCLSHYREMFCTMCVGYIMYG